MKLFICNIGLLCRFSHTFTENMLSSLVKEHQAKQAARKESQGMGFVVIYYSFLAHIAHSVQQCDITPKMTFST